MALLSCIRTIGFVSADVLQLFDVLFDEGVFRKEVFLEWTLAAAEKGNYLALTEPLSGFFMWLSKTEDAGYA